MITRRGRGQVTIFIIMAIILVALIVLFFAIPRINEIRQNIMFEPEDYIKQCTEDGVKEAIGIMLNQAGYIQPENYILYQDNKVSYLCYVANYYQSCINQEPVYIGHLESEIKDYIVPKIKDCFLNLEEEYENRYYTIETSPLNLSIKLLPSQVRIDITKKFYVTRGEEERKYEGFEFDIVSSLFELGNVAREIVNQESKYCNFEYLGYMLLYPRFNIDKKNIGSAETSSKVYIIQDRESGEKLYIAVRSCAIPPGF